MNERLPRGLYVHFPFCAKRCHYCDFSVSRARRPPIADYLEAVEADLDEWFESRGWNDGLPLETIFVGGGTPSLLGSDGMVALAELLKKRFAWDPESVEWTVEANPNSLDAVVAREWRHVGVNRLSLGVQSFQAGPLEWLGRLHGVPEAEAAVAAALDAGFDNVNVDLIFGLPEDVPRDWKHDVRSALDLGATHVSAYGLTAEPLTPLGRWVDLGRVRMPEDGRYAEEYLLVSAIMSEAGFGHYEVSNFALEGRASRHNWLYWDGSDYLGVGPSAHSLLLGERIWNVFRWDRYREAVRAGSTLREGRERPDPDQRELERIWLGLRTEKGIGRERLSGETATRRLEAWEAEGWIRPHADIRLTPAGWLRLDALAAEIATWSDTGN